jgi:outer membrane protein TolC
MTSRTIRTIVALAVILTGWAFGTRSAAAQATTGAQAISLPDAIRRAEQQSEVVGIARAGATRAEGELLSARSLIFPQLSANAGYTRTLKSQFEGFGGDGSGDTEPDEPAPPGPCRQYLRDASASIEERVGGVEQATRCSLGSSLFDSFGTLPFGQENQWSIGLQLSQPLFSGGRITAGYDVARAGRRAADIEVTAQTAQLTIEVTESYYDAALADRLVEIADSALAQAELALRHVELAHEVGDKSEFELLRARVTRDNQRPVVIQRRSQREIAYFRLKQLLGIELETPLQLTTRVQEDNLQIGQLPQGSDTSAAMRASVRQAMEAAEVSEGLLRIQRAERMPAVNLTSSYGRVGYPSSVFPAWDDFLDNWTVGVGLQVPVFTGGRLRGAELVARANLDEARLRVRQVMELAALDARATVASLREAEEAWRASAGTVEQARRAYEIAEIRFREGLSTQLELTEARVLLQQAQANRAVAARNVQVIQAKLAVLRDLPLAGSPGQGGASGGSGNQQLQQELLNRAQQQQNTQTTMPGGVGGTGLPGSGGLD